MFREEAAYPDNAPRANFVFLGYPFHPPIARDDYAAVVNDIEGTLPLRLWYFLDEVTTDETMRKIWRAILRSDLAVFDISGGNPNVAFEMGLAIGSDKRCMTLLKTGEPNPLGTADLGYSERIEYTSAATLKSKLLDLLRARSAALRLLDEVSYQVVPGDGSLTREETAARLLQLTNRVFTSKSVTKAGATTVMGTEGLALAALSALRQRDVLQVVGVKRGARYVFTGTWAYHDHEVAGI
jgi:hypothetical protein